VFGEPILAVIAGLVGAMLGSFLNVCVYRLPRNESVVRPRSRCPRCEKQVAWYDNIPVVSWLVLRARCRHCGQPISVQYPLVELAVALIWAGCAYVLGPDPEALSAAVFLTLLLGILLTDAQHYIIPDEFSLGGLGAGLAFAFFTKGGIVQAVVGAAFGFGLLWAVKAAGDFGLKRGWIGGREVQETLGEEEPASSMGGGDIKMAAMIGAFTGWMGVLASIFLGALAGTLFFLPALFREKKPLVPFGIFLALGAAAWLLAGARIGAWYGARFTW
jgi:leader peptidase (prepilin peptidase)/N-methyltransferase